MITLNIDVSIFLGTKFIFSLINRLQACLFLSFIPGFGNIRARKLWEFSGSPESIFE